MPDHDFNSAYFRAANGCLSSPLCQAPPGRRGGNPILLLPGAKNAKLSKTSLLGASVSEFDVGGLTSHPGSRPLAVESEP